MASQSESQEGAGRASSLGGPAIAVGAFAAGAAVTLVVKRLIDARRDTGPAAEGLDIGDNGSKDDLATVLRRAALDVAAAATGRAAERLQSQDADAETEAEPEPEAVESSSR